MKKHSEIDIENLKKYSDEDLIYFLKLEKEREDEAYQIFCDCAASRSAPQVEIFCEAAKNQKEIKKEMLNRRLKKAM